MWIFIESQYRKTIWCVENLGQIFENHDTETKERVKAEKMCVLQKVGRTCVSVCNVYTVYRMKTHVSNMKHVM